MNVAVSARGKRVGLDHVGIQAETKEELAEVYGRLRQANQPVVEKGAMTCCYAQSEKAWIADPSGLSWETFLTLGESTVYGDHADHGAIRTTSGGIAAAACCMSATTQDACCGAG